jgi:long-subunit fatty acid transport protein
MKRNLIILTVLMLFSFTMKAQDKAKPFNFSFRMGPNLSWMKSNSEAVNKDGSILGFSWGALCEFPIQNNYAFVSGFNINFAGGKIDYQGLKQGTPVLQIGLGTSFRLNARLKRSYPLPMSSSLPGYASEDINSDNLTSFIKESLLIGIGAQYTLQDNLKLVGGLSFNNGFTDVLKKGPYNTGDPKVISNFVELNIGLNF